MPIQHLLTWQESILSTFFLFHFSHTRRKRIMQQQDIFRNKRNTIMTNICNYDEIMMIMMMIHLGRWCGETLPSILTTIYQLNDCIKYSFSSGWYLMVYQEVKNIPSGFMEISQWAKSPKKQSVRVYFWQHGTVFWVTLFQTVFMVILPTGIPPKKEYPPKYKDSSN